VSYDLIFWPHINCRGIHLVLDRLSGDTTDNDLNKKTEVEKLTHFNNLFSHLNNK
jgi:hypothetical protein